MEDPNQVHLALLFFFNCCSLAKHDGVLLQFMFCTLELITHLKGQLYRNDKWSIKVEIDENYKKLPAWDGTRNEHGRIH